MEKLEFSKEDQEFIDATIAGKPSPKMLAYWNKKGMNIEQHTKWYRPPQLKERLRSLNQKYKIGSCHKCHGFPSVKLTWKLDGISLVEYWCATHYSGWFEY